MPVLDYPLMINCIYCQFEVLDLDERYTLVSVNFDMMYWCLMCLVFSSLLHLLLILMCWCIFLLIVFIIIIYSLQHALFLCEQLQLFQIHKWLDTFLSAFVRFFFQNLAN